MQPHDRGTTAILHHRLRNSGREVSIRLAEAGIEIVSTTGDHIAVWPFDALTLAQEQRLADSVALRLPHDDLLELHIAGKAWVSAITERSPAIAAARRKRWLDTTIRVWLSVPDDGRIVLTVVGFGLIIWWVYLAYKWIANLL